MEQLKQRFRERLAARAAALRAALAELHDAPEDATAALRRIGHALYGSGGTYGFPAISEAAKDVEDASDAELRSAVGRLLAILDVEQHAGDVTSAVILLVDDDAETDALLSAIVAPLGARVERVETATEARARLQEETFAVVLLDLMLPDADGRTVLLWMREQDTLFDTPVFVMSGLGSARVQAECYSIGAHGFFEKPIDPDVVRAAISSRLVDRVARRSEPASPPPSAPAAVSPSPLYRRVILVEDDDLVSSIIKHRLTRAGFEVVHFSDGVEARELASADEVCAMILDIKIPGIDGFELLAELKDRAAFAKVPVIILTALNNERDVVRGLELGAADYMVKPFSPTELLARVNRLLQTA
jgi:DNA-binding response OmpR family regulator